MFSFLSNIIHAAAGSGTSDTNTTIDLSPSGEGLAVDLSKITVPGIISGAIKFAMVVAAVVFFFILVVGGIRWIVSGGDKAQTETARNQITAALVGLVIVFAAWAIIKLIETFFGIDILGGLTIPSIQ